MGMFLKRMLSPPEEEEEEGKEEQEGLPMIHRVTKNPLLQAGRSICNAKLETDLTIFKALSRLSGSSSFVDNDRDACCDMI